MSEDQNYQLQWNSYSQCFLIYPEQYCWPCDPVVEPLIKQSSACIVEVTYYSLLSGLYQSLAPPVWALINPQSHTQPHIHRGEGVFNAFYGIKASYYVADCFKTLSRPKETQQSFSLLLCYWSNSDVCMHLSGKCLSPQACVPNVSGPDMCASEDSRS